MKAGLRDLTALLEEGERDLMISPVRQFNRGLFEAFEFFHMVRISSLILNAALTREESRGAHYREDFPLPDNARWLVNIILGKSAEGVAIQTEKVKTTHLNPENSSVGKRASQDLSMKHPRQHQVNSKDGFPGRLAQRIHIADSFPDHGNPHPSGNAPVLPAAEA